MWERPAANHINLQERCTQDAFYLRKHTESGSVSATHVLVEKRYGIRERLVAGHMNLQSQGTLDAFYVRKHKDSRGVGTARIFHLKNTTISPRLVGVTYKFTVKMKARRILHEKTQGFPRGRRE